MRLRVLIVDDEPPARRRLRSLLESEADIDLVGEAQDGPDAVDRILELVPDLVLLDVQMPGLDGFQVLNEVAKKSPRSPEGTASAIPAVVFITAYDEYALKAFEAHAVDYLLKPFDDARLRRAIERGRLQLENEALRERMCRLAAEATEGPHRSRLLVKEAGHIHFVPVESIDWVQADDHYLSVHAGGRTHLLRETLAGLEKQLDPQKFARIHRGTIVNLDRILRLTPEAHGDFEVELSTGDRLMGTRRYAASLRDRLANS